MEIWKKIIIFFLLPTNPGFQDKKIKNENWAFGTSPNNFLKNDLPGWRGEKYFGLLSSWVGFCKVNHPTWVGFGQEFHPYLVNLKNFTCGAENFPKIHITWVGIFRKILFWVCGKRKYDSHSNSNSTLLEHQLQKTYI